MGKYALTVTLTGDSFTNSVVISGVTYSGGKEPPLAMEVPSDFDVLVSFSSSNTLFNGNTAGGNGGAIAMESDV